jgi:molybdopterin converting factor subunit 1
MQVRVLFFGVLKEFAGKSGEQVELREGSSVNDLLEHYSSQIPRIKESLPSLAVAVNQQYAGAETLLKADDEVALLPPVSGGMDEAGGETPAGQPPGRRRYDSEYFAVVVSVSKTVTSFTLTRPLVTLFSRVFDSS